MTFDSRLANIRAPVVRGLYCPSSQILIEKTLHEITVNSQGQLNRFSLTVGSSVTPQRHTITSGVTRGLSQGRQSLAGGTLPKTQKNVKK